MRSLFYLQMMIATEETKETVGVEEVETEDSLLHPSLLLLAVASRTAFQLHRGLNENARVLIPRQAPLRIKCLLHLRLEEATLPGQT
jgi:hypothetical protein